MASDTTKSPTATDPKSAASPTTGAPIPTQAKNGTTATRPAGNKKPRKLTRLSQDLPPQWKPQQDGEKLCGFYVKSMTITSKGRSFPIHIIQSEETGEVQSFTGAVANRLFERMPRGTYVEVTFVGWDQNTKGDDMKMFELDYDENADLLPEPDEN